MVRVSSLQKNESSSEPSGLKSPARNVLNADNDKGPSRYHLAAHRATVEMAEIRADPVTSWIADSQDLNFWCVCRRVTRILIVDVS